MDAGFQSTRILPKEKRKRPPVKDGRSFSLCLNAI
jgi:hypothetical protein